MENNKPKWHKPKLVVLVRDTEAEKVLVACKVSAGGSSTNAVQNVQGCTTTGASCAACQSRPSKAT